MTYEFHYRRHAETLYQALREDAFYATLVASVTHGSAQAAMVRYMDFSMREADRFGILHLPKDETYGASIWAKPLEAEHQTEKHDEKHAFLCAHLGPESLATYGAIVDFMSARAEPLVPESAWYLSILGVRPQRQGQGLGPGLVNAVLAETDERGVPTYLETFTPRSITFYQRLGYQRIERIEEPTTGAPYWLMVRPAHSAD